MRFGIDTLGKDFQGSAMHQTLLAAYDKLVAPDVVSVLARWRIPFQDDKKAS